MPPRASGRITDVALRNAKPAEKAYKLAVGGGLYLEVTPGGSKLWRWKYRLAGKENRYAIGRYPEYSLTEARQESEKARQLVKQGTQPSHHKRLMKLNQATEHANTFEAVALEWLSNNAIRWIPRTYIHRKKALERDVFPAIGTLPVRQVTPSHVLEILRRVEKRAPAMAAMLNQAISSICRLAVVTLRSDGDPTNAVRGALKSRITIHRKPLKPSELPAFMSAIDESAAYFPTKVALKLMLYTLARSFEVVGAAWEEFDLDNSTWVVPATRMKMREEHLVPLPAQAIALLRQLHAMTPRRHFLFPNRNKPTQPASRGLLWKSVVAMDLGISPHGIRATGSTILNSMGFRSDLIEKQLAHQERSKSRASYNRAIYLEERREMMQQWADYLDQLARGASVVPMKMRA